MDTVLVEPTLPLADRYARLKADNPKLRIRDAATSLAVSELELVAAQCAGPAVRLKPEWPAIFASLPELGRVMALTRNESAVHEKDGTYNEVSFQGMMGLVLDPEIDLRIFVSHFAYGFVVRPDTPEGHTSLQFFDRDGGAVHKIYLRPASDREAFERLAERFTDPDPAPIVLSPLPAPPAVRPDAEIDQAGLLEAWDGLQDTHDFFGLLKRFGVERTQSFRLAGDTRAKPVDLDVLNRCLTLAAERALPIMIFVGSPGVIQIHTGPVHKIAVMGPWINVLDEGFNLHLRQDAIAQAWIVYKPTRDGTVTSLELFDRDNGTIATLFGKRKPGQPEDPEWRRLVADLAEHTPA